MIHHFFPMMVFPAAGRGASVSPVNVRSVDSASELQNHIEWKKAVE